MHVSCKSFNLERRPRREYSRAFARKQEKRITKMMDGGKSTRMEIERTASAHASSTLVQIKVLQIPSRHQSRRRSLALTSGEQQKARARASASTSPTLSFHLPPCPPPKVKQRANQPKVAASDLSVIPFHLEGTAPLPPHISNTQTRPPNRLLLGMSLLLSSLLFSSLLCRPDP